MTRYDMKSIRTSVFILVAAIGFILPADPGQGADNAASVTAPSANLQLTDSEHAWLRSHPRITLGFTLMFEPGLLRNLDGSLGGLFWEFLEIIRQRTPIEIDVELDTWPNMQAKAERGEVDGLVASGSELAQQLGLLATTPYWHNPITVFARSANAKHIRDFSDLAGRKVAVIAGNLANLAKLQQAAPNAEIIEVESAVAGLKAVYEDKVYAFAGYSAFGYQIVKHQLSGIVPALLEEEDQDSPASCIAVRADWPELVSILNKVLATISEEETLAINQKWIPLRGSAAAPVKSVQLTDAERAWLARHPVINIGIGESWTPFIYKKNDGSLEGYDVDLLAKINELTGANIRLMAGPWQDIVEQAERRDIDGLAESAVVEGRRAHFQFSDPYNVVEYTAATLPEHAAGVRTVSDLKGKRIAHLKGNLWTSKILASIGKVQSIETGSEEEAFRFVIEGKADFALIPLHQYGPLRKIYHQTLAIAYVFTNEELVLNAVYSLRKDWPELVSIINKALSAIDTRERQALFEKWAPTLAVPAESALPEPVQFDEIPFLLKSLGFIALCITVSLIVVWLLRGRPRQLSIRDTLLFVSLVFAMLIVSSAIFVIILLNGQEQQHVVEVRKGESLELALELKQSSDDLTRFARTYVVTGDPQYERFYWAIVAIRDGEQPHPKDFTRSYWDHVAAGLVELDHDGELYSIEDRMIELGLTEEEVQKLSEAKGESDALIDLEEVAMNAVKGLYQDANGQFTDKGAPDLVTAHRLMHGKEYHAAKARIMRPIDQFFSLLEARTANELNLVRRRNRATILGIMILVTVTIGFSIYVFLLLRRRIISPLGVLEAGAETIEQGNYLHRIDLPSRDEIGSLSRAFNSMAHSIETHTQELRKLSRAIESSPTSVVITDRDGVIEYVNPKFIDMTGYSAEEAIGRTPRMLASGNHSPEFYREMWNTITAGREWRGEIENRRKDGRLYWEHAAISPILNTGGKLTHYVAVQEDITARKKAEATFRAIVEGTSKVTGEAFFQHLVKHLATAFEMRYALVAELTDHNSSRAHTLAVWDSDHFVPNFEYDLSGTPSDTVRKQGSCFYPANVQAVFPNDRVLVEIDAESYVGNPLIDTTGRVCGILAVLGTHPAIENPLMSSLLEIFSARAAGELERQRSERIIATQAERMRALHEIISSSGLSDAETITGLLRKGSELLGLTVGALSRIEDGEYTIEYAYGTKAGRHFRLEETLCATVFRENHTLAISHASQSEYRDHPRIRDGVESYIATPFWIHNRLYGTLKFSGPIPRKEDYSSRDKDFVEVIARLSGVIMYRMEIDRAMAEAKEQAEAANRIKSAFLANMSHEIRTPMNAVLGFLDLVLEDSSLPAPQRQHLATARSSARGLLGVINDILDVSKLESGKLTLEQRPFSLRRLMRDIHVIMELKARDKELDLQLAIHPAISGAYLGDPLRLRQILINLLGNAIKFTEQGHVSLRLAPAEEDGTLTGDSAVSLLPERGRHFPPEGGKGWVTGPKKHSNSVTHPQPLTGGEFGGFAAKNLLHFTIEDTGIGIPADRLSQIFAPFAQADASMTRRFGGTGLGTAIARQLVELMGGRIWAESEEGWGSRFHVIIPLSPTVQVPEDAAQTLARGARRRFRILLAEDVQANVDLAKIRLEQQGHTVTVAWNGREAVEAFERGHPDLILMDIQMPKMGGLEATMRIRELEAETGGRVPIVAMTASVLMEERQTYLDAGMDAVTAKPIDFGELFQIMEEVVPEGVGENVPDKPPEAKGPGEGAFPSLAGVDINKGLKTWQNADTYTKALLGFARDYGDAAIELTRVLADGDLDNASRLAHTLKGLAGNLAVTDVVAAAIKIDAALREQRLEEVNVQLPTLEAALHTAIETIRSLDLGPAGDDAPKKELNMPRLTELFRNMLAAFEQFNPSVIEPFLSELREYLPQGRLASIEQYLGRFDFEGARDATLTLANSLNIDPGDRARI